MDRIAERGPDRVAADLTDPSDGVVSLLDGRDIERIELNFQAYRISAGADRTDFGSTAEYVIRVFRWNPDQKKFTPSYLTNQIDRARLLGNPLGDSNSCDRGVRRPMSKARFLAYVTRPVVLSDIDNGTLNIPQEFLACRAVTASPGGAHRSRNSMFWNASNPAEQIITDAQIERAMRRAQSPSRQFSFMKSPNDFRLRINGLSCSGCHQERAIAGFHFPGADRPGAPVSNSVYLPGSAAFPGDQARRQEVLRRLARGDQAVALRTCLELCLAPAQPVRPGASGHAAARRLGRRLPASRGSGDEPAGVDVQAGPAMRRFVQLLERARSRHLHPGRVAADRRRACRSAR